MATSDIRPHSNRYKKIEKTAEKREKRRQKRGSSTCAIHDGSKAVQKDCRIMFDSNSNGEESHHNKRWWDTIKKQKKMENWKTGKE